LPDGHAQHPGQVMGRLVAERHIAFGGQRTGMINTGYTHVGYR